MVPYNISFLGTTLCPELNKRSLKVFYKFSVICYVAHIFEWRVTYLFSLLISSRLPLMFMHFPCFTFSNCRIVDLFVPLVCTYLPLFRFSLWHSFYSFQYNSFIQLYFAFIYFLNNIITRIKRRREPRYLKKLFFRNTHSFVPKKVIFKQYLFICT